MKGTWAERGRTVSLVIMEPKTGKKSLGPHMEPFMTLTLNELIINFIQESIWNRSNKNLLQQTIFSVRLCKVEFSRVRLLLFDVSLLDRSNDSAPEFTPFGF